MRTLSSLVSICGLLVLSNTPVLADDTGGAAPTKPQAPATHPLPVLPPGARPSVLPAPGTGAPSTNEIGPKITFEETVYDFGRVRSGDPVKHTYIFTNTGNQVLELSNVQPQCGCTAAGDWTRRVEPGQTGKIPIQFNTTSYSHPVVKAITVYCNDNSQRVVVLQLKGTVWKPIELVPPYPVLNVLPDNPNASALVRIINNTDEPLKLSSPESNNESFKAELKETNPGKEYEMTITPVPPLHPGTIQGKVTLKSSSTNAPTMDVPFWANIQAAVMVLPAQLTLSSYTQKPTGSVTVQNNTTNVLTVSDAKVSVPGADVTVKELQPGRIFNIQVAFPEGFQLAAGKKEMLTFKTSNPQFSTVEVPVYQPPRPVTPIQPMPLGGPSAPRLLPKPMPRSAQLTPYPGPIVVSPGTNAVKLQ